MTEQDDSADPRIERSRRVVRKAALAELAEVGYGGFTIESVSARCGVARSTIYRHWPEKLALIADALETLNEQPESASDPVHESPRQLVHRLLQHLAEVFQDSIISACVPALIEGAERSREVREFHHGYNARRGQALVDTIAAGIAAGEISESIHPELAAVAMAGPIIYQRVMTSKTFDPDQVEELVNMVLGDRPPGSDTHGGRPQRASRR